MFNKAPDEGRSDVVVVGAGFSGLRAATLLAEQGIDVVVLEARDRVGGKVEAQPDASGAAVDTGGQFVCDDMTHVTDLVRSLGRQLVEVADFLPGLAFYGDVPTGDPVALARTDDAAWAAWEELGDDPPPAVLPGQSTDAWLAARIDDPVMLRAARGGVGSMMCMPLDRIAAADTAFASRRTPLTGPELQYIVAETMHRVAVDLADALPRPVRLSSPVECIRRDADSVLLDVAGPDGPATLRAREIVLAVPPAAVPHIAFEPPLPDAVATACRAYRAGDVFKFLVGYDRPFWRRAGVGATRRFLHPAGLYCCEAGPPDRPTIVAFLGGIGAYELQGLDPDERRQLVVDRLVEAYGAEAARPVSFIERDWRPDRWGGGGYCNEVVIGPDAPPASDTVATLLSGVPGITFASTELADAFPGYIEGALRAGRAAAESVLARRAGRRPV